MSEKFIDKIERRLIVDGLAVPDEVRGCSRKEVDQLEEKLQVKFPPVYREFLLRMGRQAGRLFLGPDVFLGRLRELREYAIEILAESSSQFKLPADCHVFYVHQGYVFMYFPTSQGDDPPVYLFAEGDRYPKETAASFSAFLSASVEGALEMKTQREDFRRRHGLD